MRRGWKWTVGRWYVYTPGFFADGQAGSIGLALGRTWFVLGGPSGPERGRAQPARSLTARRGLATGALRSPMGTLLLGALVAGLVLWLLGPGRPNLSAMPALPASQPGPAKAAWIWEGDAQSRIPRQPMAVALLQGGDLLVADAALGQVHRFGPDGRLRQSYSGGGTLRYPVGLAVAEDDRVWVTDLEPQRLYRLDLATDSLAEVPPGPKGYQAPGSLLYYNGLLYVADLGRHQVLVLDAGGRLLRVVGAGKGKGPGELLYPNGIWVTANGEVFVTDSNNGRIQLFDAQGRLERILQPHRLLLPRGLVRDGRGRLHVADTMANDVAVLDATGYIVARRGAAEGLTLPNGLATRGGLLYIADRGNGRVVVWELDDD